MKVITFLLTLFFHALVSIKLELLANFYSTLAILIIGSTLGFLLCIRSKKEAYSYQFGWGILCGSLLYLVIIILFILWLTYNYPK